MPTIKSVIEFDPGFAPYILEFQGSIEYLYRDINKFKNFSQRKMKFSQYYNKMLQVFYNNVGFYTGCLMWACYIKTVDKQEISGNYCYGKKYNEEENISDIQALILFCDNFPKDIKYFLGKNFEFEANLKALLEAYKSFVILNKGFTETKYNTDIVLPSVINTTESCSFNNIIRQVIADKDLSKLAEYRTKIL